MCIDMRIDMCMDVCVGMCIITSRALSASPTLSARCATHAGTCAQPRPHMTHALMHACTQSRTHAHMLAITRARMHVRQDQSVAPSAWDGRYFSTGLCHSYCETYVLLREKVLKAAATVLCGCYAWSVPCIHSIHGCVKVKRLLEETNRPRYFKKMLHKAYVKQKIAKQMSGDYRWLYPLYPKGIMADTCPHSAGSDRKPPRPPSLLFGGSVRMPWCRDLL